MKRTLLLSLIMSVLALFLLACSGGGDTAPEVQRATATPFPTPTSIPVSKDSILSVPTVAKYYLAIKDRNYEKAYTYLATDAVDDSGKIVTKSVFLTMAQEGDNQNGPVVNVEIVPDSKDSRRVVLTIDRNSGLHYHSHLNLKLVGNSWKIVSLDRV